MVIANFYREVRAARIGREWRVTLGHFGLSQPHPPQLFRQVPSHTVKLLIWVLSFLSLAFTSFGSFIILICMRKRLRACTTTEIERKHWPYRRNLHTGRHR
jgi:hypothetical protein